MAFDLNKVLRILMIEDALADVVLINSELRKGGLQFRSKRVETKESFLDEIRNEPPDLIIADHGLPSFDSFTALTIARNECPDVPFIFVTGSMGEELAIETLKSGATDYVLKSRLSNLVPAVEKALFQADERVKLRQMSDELKVSEERFRTLVEGVRDYAIFMLDTSGRITSWNAGAEWIENYPASEIIGHHFACLFLDADAAVQKPEETLKQAAAAGRFEGEGWLQRKNGAKFWAKTVISPLRDESRTLRGFAVVIQDMTQHQQNQEIWKRYEAIINTARDFFTLIDSDHRYVAANEAYCRAHAKPRSELLGRSVSEVWGEETYHQTIREPLQRCLEGHEVRYQAWFAFPAQGKRYFEVTYYPYSPQGDVTHVIVVTHDITELHRAQRSVEELNRDLEHQINVRSEELKAAADEMESFRYSISHDLRAPLRHISGFAELLQQAAAAHLNEDAQRYLNTISNSAKRMGTLIDELLAFSRIVPDQLNLSRIDLAELVNSVREDIKDQAGERAIDWKLGELPHVWADPVLLRKVLQYLFSNALKFTRDRPKAEIEVGGTTSAEETIVFIRDNGVGFSMEYAERLFGVFRKLHPPQQFEGAGIGLAKVRRIIQRHGGRTWAEGELDRGATFYFSLPNTRVDLPSPSGAS